MGFSGPEAALPGVFRRLLTNPTLIGEASLTFLECMGQSCFGVHGHGLLDVPENANQLQHTELVGSGFVLEQFIFLACYSPQERSNMREYSPDE